MSIALIDRHVMQSIRSSRIVAAGSYMSRMLSARYPGISCATAMLALATATPAVADDAPANEQIVVTGQAASLQRAPAAGKTGTPLIDLPASVELIDRGTIEAQGGVSLQDAIGNASGVGRGGGDGFGFYDRFLIRGLDARIYSDGFSDGDQRNGLPHSLNGVEQVEVFKGPGSSLFGSGPPGGSINIVHYVPSEQAAAGGGLQIGSFDTINANAYATGSLGIQGLSYRIDGQTQYSSGFRNLPSHDDEIRPSIAWRTPTNTLVVSVDARWIAQTPDPAGIIYFQGRPIQGVGRDAKYSTPFSYGNQRLVRVQAVDTWMPAPFVTITNRFSYLHRALSLLRNGDSGTVVGTSFTGRQLRHQDDHLDAYDYQFEPVWTFHTAGIGHTLLTGFEAQRQDLDTNRATADLPAIPDIFAPVPPETSTQGLTFLRDATHAGAIDVLQATYISLYATDQIDLTDRLKLRLGARKDWFTTSLDPLVNVPGRLDANGDPLVAGITETQHEAPVSWNAGVLYKLLPGITPYFGVAKSHLVVFSSESTQSGLAPVESGLQYEAGLKISALQGHAVLTGAWFDTNRNHVFQLVGDTPVFNNQRTRGVDADLDIQATKRWHLAANATIQSARITDNPGIAAANGKRPQGVPSRIAHVWTTYQLTGGAEGGIRFGGGAEYRSKMFGNITNTTSVPGYVTEEAVVSYAQPRWEISAGVKNLSNKTWFAAANGAGALLGDPRTVFVSARLHMHA
jgi:iron complex outermembrane receptor protein